MFKTLTVLALCATDAFSFNLPFVQGIIDKFKPKSNDTNALKVIDLSDLNVVLSVIQNGINVTAQEPQTIQVKSASGTGYQWSTKITPEGCISIKQSLGEAALTPGGSKTVNYTLERVSTVSSESVCSFTMALNRPWVFKGFNDDGSLIDQSSASDSFQIPVNLK